MQYKRCKNSEAIHCNESLLKSVPGMGYSLEVKVHYRLGSRNCEAEAKPRTDEQELYIRLTWNGRVCFTKQSPILPEFHTVNTAVTWGGYSSYPGSSYKGSRQEGRNFLQEQSSV